MNLLTELTLQQILGRLAAFVLLTMVHGALLAGLARLMGDRGPQYDGRLTLSPGPHLNVPGVFSAILFRLGWIQPMAIDPAQLRLGRWGLVLVVLGSLALTLALVPLVLALRPMVITMLPMTFANGTINVMLIGVEVIVWFVVLNVLPFPPLTGAHLLYAAFPPARAFFKRRLGMATVIVFLLAVLGTLDWALAPVRAPLLGFLLGR